MHLGPIFQPASLGTNLLAVNMSEDALYIVFFCFGLIGAAAVTLNPIPVGCD